MSPFNNKIILLFTSFLLIIAYETGAEKCVVRDFGESSFVCVCNSTYCNFDRPPTVPDEGQVRVITTSRDEHRNLEQIFNLPEINSFNSSDVNISIFIDSSHLYQTMIGIGGSFTDAASINMMSLSTLSRENLLRLYFSEDGSRYNLVRVPIAGSDFSTRPYSYDDVEGDVELNYFSLTEEDFEFKLPVMKRATQLCPDELYIFGSPWSPPAWMKTNGMFNESGELLKEMWQPYANYIVKFIEAYEEELGVNLWGMTPQNEPLTGFDPEWSFNACGWSSEDMKDWLTQNLGPTLMTAGYRRLKMMVDDYNRYTLPWYSLPMLTDNNTSIYVDGVAFHWYEDSNIGPEVMDETHELNPDKFLLMTEACQGLGDTQHVMLGSWERGELYIKDVIQNINHWSTGWVDWNLALSLQGGPNWVNNFADAAIIVNEESDEFYVQPMYYALNMFSRIVQRGANRIYHTILFDENDSIRATTFLNPDGKKIIVIANVSEDDLAIGIADQTNDYIFRTLVQGKSWVSITF